MKIIKEGRIPKIRYRGTCANCGCVIECTYKELELEEDRGRDYLTYKCPTCDLTMYCKEYPAIKINS
jgi:hypothetical protein